MRRSICLSITMVLCVLALLLFGLAPETAADAGIPGPVVLLVEDDTGAFLLQVKQGAQQAAAQAGCELTQETAALGSLEETARQWAQRGATAALVLMQDTELRREAAAAFRAEDVPVVLLGETAAQGASAAMDQRQAGELLGSYARVYPQVYLYGDAPACQEGALSVLEPGQAVETGAFPAPEEQACAVALTPEETLRLAAMKEAGQLTVPLVGMDPGGERVQLMASGAVDALAIETPYALGYVAMEAALSGAKAPCMLPYRLVEREEMYAAQNVKLMFPLLH